MLRIEPLSMRLVLAIDAMRSLCNRAGRLGPSACTPVDRCILKVNQLTRLLESESGDMEKNQRLSKGGASFQRRSRIKAEDARLVRASAR